MKKIWSRCQVIPVTIEECNGHYVKIQASDKQADDNFGWAVSIPGDTIVVGAYREYTGGAEAGAAYIFSRNQDVNWCFSDV